MSAENWRIAWCGGNVHTAAVGSAESRECGEENQNSFFFSSP